MKAGIWVVVALFGVIGMVEKSAEAGNNPSPAPLTGVSLQYDRVIGICHLSENPYDLTSAVNSISPPLAVKNYFRVQEHYKIEGQPIVSVLLKPSNGILLDGGNGNFSYLPEKDYLGNDRATLLVEVGGKKVRMEYYFRVMQQVPDQEGINPYDNCPNKVRVWKISSTLDSSLS